MSDKRNLNIVGADANNLRNIECDFPLKGLSAVVGVSGSGKSSLLQNVIAAEATRRNILFHGSSKNDGSGNLVRAYMSPAPATLFVGQRPFRGSSRTTVGTATGILGDLRSLFLADGYPVTGEGKPVPSSSPETYTKWLINHYSGRATIWTIPLRWVKSDGREAAQRLLSAGITSGVLRSENDAAKLHETGKAVDLTRWRPLSANQSYSLEANVGSLAIKGPQSHQELHAFLSKAWAISGFNVIVELHDAPKDLAPSPRGAQLDAARHYVHPDHRELFRSPDRHLLSFNAPEHEDSGACPLCKGIGRRVDLSIDALISQPEKSLNNGAITLWTPKNYQYVNIQHETIEGLKGRNGFNPETPWQNLSDSARSIILDGTGDELIQGFDPKTGKKQGAPRKFEGFRNAILRRIETPSGAKNLGTFVVEGPCPQCHGTRWSRQARALRAGARSLAVWLSTPLAALSQECHAALKAQGLSKVGHSALKRLAARAEMLTRLGLGHLSADRGMQTASDGESRRLQIGATLAISDGNLMLLLDEPARGLHEQDLDPMISILQGLSQDHCVLLNEHRNQVIKAADYVLTLGPGSGPDGGEIVTTDPVNTTSYGPLNTGTPSEIRDWLTIKGASMHNIQNQNVSLPLGTISAIVGVSGSGKSSFARGILIPALLKGKKDVSGDAAEAYDIMEGRWSSIDGLASVRDVHVLYQRVPPRNRRSLVVTLTGTLDIIATFFAATPEAKAAKLTAKDFGLNGGEGRCPKCLGTGTDEQDDGAACPACGGRRYRAITLTPTVAELDIAETLAQPVSRLLQQWSDHEIPQLSDKLGPLFSTMTELGLGHIALGRRADSLSGGEIQRLRVAQTLANGKTTQGHLFFLDEPAAGLHQEDTHRLINVFNRMIDGGRNTVIIIEHNMHMVRAVDWLIEFGPEAGPAGGKVIAKGTPAEVAEMETPTGRALSLNSNHQKPQSSYRLSGLKYEIEYSSLDQLIGGDLDEPESKRSTLDERLLAGRRLWEVGDLNLEVGKLILDEWDRRINEEKEKLLELWHSAPDSRLAINPALSEMRVWGTVLPLSVAKELIHRLPQMGLLPYGKQNIESISQAPAKLRAIMHPTADTKSARQAALKHALAMGGGFVELWSRENHRLVTVTTTAMKPERGLVGPQSLSLGHFSRLRPEGLCPTCNGKGHILGTDPGLLIKSGRSGFPQEPENVLTSELTALMKGIWRSDARPFFRRLEEEGLLDDKRLKQDLLFGFWRRPSHGTFLKGPKEEPDEVGSWLRWDGLYRHMWSELPRSKDKKWAQKVEHSKRPFPCPVCAGSGHGVAAQLLTLGDRSFAHWATEGTLQELRKALNQLNLSCPREKKTQKRLLSCLNGTGRLGASAEGHHSFALSVRQAFVTEGA